MFVKIRIIIFFCANLFAVASMSQNSDYPEFSSAINLIKQSNTYKNYCADYNVPSNLKVSPTRFPLCEEKIPTEIEKRDSLFNYCNNYDYLMIFPYKTKNLRRLSDNGRKKMVAKFSDNIYGCFMVKIKYIGDDQTQLKFMFQTENGEVKLIKTMKTIIDF